MKNSSASGNRNYVPMIARHQPRADERTPPPPPTGPQDTQDGILDFGAALRAIRRRWAIIALCVGVCLAIATVVRGLSPDSYTATARVLLSETQIQPFGRENLFQGISLNNPVIESQMELIRSPFLISRVVERLELANDPRLTEPASTAMKAFFDDIFAALGLADQLEPAPPPPDERLAAYQAVQKVRSNLRVGRDPSARVIDIRFTSGSPEFAAEMVNAIAESYLNSRVLQRQEAAENAATWFDERIAELEIRASEAESRLASLRVGRANGTARPTQNGTDLARLQTDLRQLISRQLVVQSELSRIDAALGGASADTLVAASDLLPAGAVPAPTVAAVTQGDAAARETLRAALDRQAAELRGQLDTVRAALTATRERIAQQSANGGPANGGSDSVSAAPSGTELRALESEARIYRTLYESYFESYLQTVQQQSFPDSESLIIQSALPPEFPTGPSLSRLGPIALLLGTVLGLGAAGIREAMDGSVRTPQQLARAINAPYLGLWPRYTRSLRRKDKRMAAKMSADGVEIDAKGLPPAHRISMHEHDPELFSVLTRPADRSAQTVRRAAAQTDRVLQDHSSGAKPHRIVGFISEGPLKERSIVAANFAEMQAAQGKRVLLIDLDWGYRALSRAVTPSAPMGLAEILSDPVDGDLEDYLWMDNRTSMYFLPNRSAIKDDLSFQAFDLGYQSTIFTRLAARFDEIVVDFSSLSKSSDAAALALSGTVDAYVVLAEFGSTSLQRLEDTMQRAQIPQHRIAGGILTGASERDLSRYGTHA